MRFIIYMLVWILAYWKVFHPDKMIKQTIIENKIITYKNNEELPIEIRMVNTLEKLGFRFPEVVIAQAIHETGKFSSDVFKDCFNIFGMKHNDRGFSKGVCREHAKYENYYAAIQDYLEYQQKYLTYYENKVIHRSAITVDDYHNFLLWIGYAEDEKYIEKLIAYENNIKSL